MPISKNYHTLNINHSNGCNRNTIMIAITEEEEELIDNIDKQTLQFERGDKIFNITMNDIFCYGEVNFKDKSTLADIDKFKFLNYLNEVGVRVYSNYDYDNHVCYSPKKHWLWAETNSPAYLAKFAHGSLGKPKRILLFSQVMK